MAGNSDSPNAISVEYLGRVAVITIDNDKKLNALSQAQYYDLAQKLREVATHDEVYVTVLIGKGRYFSAGADISVSRSTPAGTSAANVHRHWLQNFAAFNLNATQAFYSHPKILVSALNGPVVGLSAALASFADFIYATPNAFLLTPFSSLGLVAEGGASRALAQRLGPARANEALIMSRRIPATELLACGYLNKILRGEEESRGPRENNNKNNDSSDEFRRLVLQEVDDKLGEHLNGESLTGIKKLLRGPEMEVYERQNVKEVFAGLERFVKGIPQEEFRKLASGEKRHKL